MKISIITAVYNRNKTIKNAIMSIKEQTYKNIELIIIDGGSTDGTIRTIQEIIDIKDIFITEPDNGIYDALNKGLKIATGDVIAFLHSDDIYSNSFVLSSVIESFQDQKTDIVYGDISFFYPGNPSKIIRKYKSNKLSRKNLAWGKMPAHPSMFIKRNLYNEVGFFKISYDIAADYEFLCRAVNYKALITIYVPKIFVKMQLGGKSTLGIKNTILLNKEVLRAIRENGIYTNIFMLFSKYPSKILQYLRK
jgi:glycosyltransferase involved in cell wall biosynthesis